MGAMVGAESVDARSRNYQELKSRVHNDLLNRLDLDRLTRLQREVAEPEIRNLIVVLLERESAATPLSLFERESLIADVINELFGLGPLEMLLHDASISDILVNRHDQVYVEREGKLEETDIMFKDDAHLMQIIERIAASTNRARWSMRAWRTALASTPLCRPWRSTVRRCRFGGSEPTGWVRTIWSRAIPGPSRCSSSCRPRWRAGSI
jgi:hypothetical protein